MSTDDDRPAIPERLSCLFWTSLTFVIVYNLTNWLATLRESVPTAAFSWEQAIPLVPWMIVPYWSIDLFFLAAPFICKSKTELKSLQRCIVFAVCVAGIFFALFPLQLVYTREPISGVPGYLFEALFTFDRVYNLAPSLHIALRTILWVIYIPRLRGVSATALKLWFILVGVSTILCHQHQLIDLFTGQILGLLALHCFFQYVPAASQGGRSASRIRLGIRYLLASLLCIGLAAVFWLWGIVFVWPAVALLLVAFAYLVFGERFFRKEAGVFPRFTHWLLLPYTIGAHLSYLWYTRRSTAVGQVLPGLYFGRRLLNGEETLLHDRGIVSLLDLTAEYEEVEGSRELDYSCVPMLDLVAPSSQSLQRAVSIVEDKIKTGAIYVHCALGFSRSGLVVAAYLLKAKLCQSVAEAQEKLRAVQPNLLLKEDMEALLEDYLQ